jgi:hypothetical protein
MTGTRVDRAAMVQRAMVELVAETARSPGDVEPM